MKVPAFSHLPRQFFNAVADEGKGATKMVHTYALYGSGKLRITPARWQPTPMELQLAGEQFRDFSRLLLFLLIFLIPLPGVVGAYTLFALSVEKRFGDRIQLLPGSLRHLLLPNRSA